MDYPIPQNEEQRLATLRALKILDTDYEERFDRITRLAQRLYATEMASVTLVDSDRQWFKSRMGPLDAESPRDASFCTHAIIEPENSLVVGDATEDSRFSENPSVTGNPHVRFYAGHPISAPNGDTIGTICVIDSSPREVEDFDTESLRDLAEMVESEIASLTLAMGDVLTGLSNRRGFETLGEKLFEIARRVDVPLAVVFADLDNLKPINDEFGHDAGDQALEEIARLLETTLRGSDVIARFGGDEFCALLADTAAENSDVVVERINAAIDDRNKTTDSPYELSLSVGIAHDRPARSGKSLSELVDEADELMLAVKRAGKYADRAAA